MQADVWGCILSWLSWEEIALLEAAAWEAWSGATPLPRRPTPPPQPHSLPALSPAAFASAWRAALAWCSAAALALLRSRRFKEAETLLAARVADTHRIHTTWCYLHDAGLRRTVDLQVASLQVLLARAIHCQHWACGYLPSSLGKRASLAAGAAMPALASSVPTGEYVRACLLHAWNGARHIMKLPTTKREDFAPFFEIARQLQHEPLPEHAPGVGLFTEGYVRYALGFSVAGGEEDFRGAYRLQQEGFALWSQSSHALSDQHDITVEMMERLARTAHFLEAESAQQWYSRAYTKALQVWGDTAHPFAMTLRACLTEV